jgi:hypothetical protein
LKYNCEIENCRGTTDDYLCSFHSVKARSDSYQVIICEICLKIVNVIERNKGMPKYGYVKDCMRCRQKTKQ